MLMGRPESFLVRGSVGLRGNFRETKDVSEEWGGKRSFGLCAVQYCANAVGLNQGVTKRCRLSWLTHIAPSYMSPNAGGGGGGVTGSQPMSTAVRM